MDNFDENLEKSKRLVYNESYKEYHFTPSLLKSRETESTNATQMIIKKKDIRDKDYLRRELYMDECDIEKFFNCTMKYGKIEELLKKKAEKVIASSNRDFDLI